MHNDFTKYDNLDKYGVFCLLYNFLLKNHSIPAPSERNVRTTRFQAFSLEMTC